MTVDSVSALLILVAAVIPGYLFVFLVRQINRLAFDFGEAFTKTVASIICSLLLYGALEFIARLLDWILWFSVGNPNVIDDLSGMFDDSGGFSGVEDETVFTFFLIGVVWPIFCGWCLGHLTIWPKAQRCLSWFGADRASLAGSSWDYKVFQRDHDYEVEIGLADGREIRGMMSDGSVVTTSERGGDIFVQPSGIPEIFQKGNLRGIEQGTWINGSSIVSLKVLDLERIGSGKKE